MFRIIGEPGKSGYRAGVLWNRVFWETMDLDAMVPGKQCIWMLDYGSELVFWNRANCIPGIRVRASVYRVWRVFCKPVEIC